MTDIKIDYVKAYRDRHGKSRYYFRRKGFPSISLPTPGSAGFLAAYEAANAAAPAITVKPDAKIGFLPGSLGRVIEQFPASCEFYSSR